MFEFRWETPDDRAAVRRIGELAFGRPHEADLVDALREVARPLLSLVVTSDGDVVGHVLFSPVTIESADGLPAAMGLGPLAVRPDLQRHGIGSRLVRAGLDKCRRRGHDVVVVLGHPAFYARLGFVPARPHGLRCEYDAPDNAFMLAELRPGALAGCRGVVRYHAAFAGV